MPKESPTPQPEKDLNAVQAAANEAVSAAPEKSKVTSKAAVAPENPEQPTPEQQPAPAEEPETKAKGKKKKEKKDRKPFIIRARTNDTARPIRRFLIADRDWMILLVFVFLAIAGTGFWGFVVYSQAQSGSFGRNTALAEVRGDQIDWERLEELIGFIEARASIASQEVGYDIEDLLQEILRGDRLVSPDPRTLNTLQQLPESLRGPNGQPISIPEVTLVPQNPESSAVEIFVPQNSAQTLLDAVPDPLRNLSNLVP